MTSTALLVQALQALGARVAPYIPDRIEEGYGLHIDALEKLHRQGAGLVITVDCGIRSVDEVRHARQIGLDLIVTDHHSVGDQRPDDAIAVINPKLDARLALEEGRTNGYPEDMLAGVGVAYKLAQALFKATEMNDRRNFKPTIQLEDLLDLVALGTVADLAAGLARKPRACAARTESAERGQAAGRLRVDGRSGRQAGDVQRHDHRLYAGAAHQRGGAPGQRDDCVRIAHDARYGPRRRASAPASRTQRPAAGFHQPGA